MPTGGLGGQPASAFCSYDTLVPNFSHLDVACIHRMCSICGQTRKTEGRRGRREFNVDDLLTSSLTSPHNIGNLAVVDLDIGLSLWVCVGKQSRSDDGDAWNCIEQAIDQAPETIACMLNVKILDSVVRTDVKQDQVWLGRYRDLAFWETWLIV
jgi:hypothetical protein